MKFTKVLRVWFLLLLIRRVSSVEPTTILLATGAVIQMDTANKEAKSFIPAVVDFAKCSLNCSEEELFRTFNVMTEKVPILGWITTTLNSWFGYDNRPTTTPDPRILQLLEDTKELKYLSYVTHRKIDEVIVILKKGFGDLSKKMDELWDNISKEFVSLGHKVEVMLGKLKQDIIFSIKEAAGEIHLEEAINFVPNAEDVMRNMLRYHDERNTEVFLEVCKKTEWHLLNIKNVITGKTSKLKDLYLQEGREDLYEKLLFKTIAFYYRTEFLFQFCEATRTANATDKEKDYTKKQLKVKSKENIRQIMVQVLEDRKFMRTSEIRSLAAIFQEHAENDDGTDTIKEFANQLSKKLQAATSNMMYFVIWNTENEEDNNVPNNQTAFHPQSEGSSLELLQGKSKTSYIYYSIGEFNRSIALYLQEKKTLRTNVDLFTASMDFAECRSAMLKDIHTDCARVRANVIKCLESSKVFLAMGCIIGPSVDWQSFETNVVMKLQKRREKSDSQIHIYTIWDFD